MPFLQKSLAQKPPRRKGAERGFRRTKGVQKGCTKGVLAQKGGCAKGAERVQKGCRKGARTPLPAKGGGVEIRQNGPFRTKVKISHQKGRKHVVIGPKPLSNHTWWCGLGKHAKRALEGGSCAHLLATHPIAKQEIHVCVRNGRRLGRMGMVAVNGKMGA